MTTGAAIAQIGDDSRSDVWRYRHPHSLPSLAPTRISPARQSTSSRARVTTSPARKPSLASIKRMA